jgi:agmatine deiminase
MKPAPGAEAAYRWPAEWEEHAATWLVWPHNPETWPARLARIPPVFARIVRALLPGERVEILVGSAAARVGAEIVLAEARALGQTVGFHEIPTNDSWIRDFGPVFVQSPQGHSCALDWGYNAWGGKYPPWDLDQKAAQQVAALAGAEHIDRPMIFEGGSIDGDGQGTLLTTESCLLNPNRNPELSGADIERELREQLGATKLLWLADGIAGDDTDGHVDDLTRFVAPGRVVTVMEDDPADVNYVNLRENRERLTGMRDAAGRRLEIIELPMPRALRDGSERLPASYANFYIANAAVLVPIFQDEADATALGILAELFPDRAVVGIDARDLVAGLGACHCLTQQQPV